MANGHGGARSGAGRKSKAEIYESQAKAFNDACAEGLPTRLAALEALAQGAERVEDRYELALGIMMDSHEYNPSGTVVKTKRQLFPDAGEDDLVLVERKVITLEPDRAANEYLVDRILGKPTQAIEAEVTADVGGALLEAFGGALTKIYGEPVTNGDPGGDEEPAEGG